MLLRTVEPFRSGIGEGGIVRPVAVLSGVRMVHYASDMAGGCQNKLCLAAEHFGRAIHAFHRADVIVAAGLNHDRDIYLFEVDRLAQNLEFAARQLVLGVAILEVFSVHLARMFVWSAFQ